MGRKMTVEKKLLYSSSLRLLNKIMRSRKMKNIICFEYCFEWNRQRGRKEGRGRE
jgi:hypothetical protein